MTQPTPGPTPGATPDADPIRVAMTFLAALFDPADTVVIRPIETWTEAGRKRTRVGYRQTKHWPADPEHLATRLGAFLPAAAAERFNVFVGVCPRVGGGGRYDLAWQVRTVRAIWVDVDHVTVEEALHRVARAGLPDPSIVVNSGNGVHLYWLLDTAYVIDDAGDPPPVELEWPPKGSGPNKPRKYVVENGDRVYLDARRHAHRLSAKAEALQHVVAGVAHAVGGDHTQDLARLLRLPGTMNRKDERTGAAPKATELVVCDPTRRYPLSVFEPLRACSPAADRERQIAQMPLPAVRRASGRKLETLAERVAACAIAPVGCRSEADFALCCFAVRNGVAADDVWGRVETVGKFAEGGRAYFDRTWERAEYEVRADTFHRLRAENPVPDPCPADGVSADGDPGAEGGCPIPAGGPGDRPTIIVAPAETPLAVTLGQITDHLLRGGECYARADQLVRVHGDAVQPVLAAAELSGLLNQYAELYFVDQKGGAYRPLPPNYGNTWLNHARERGRLPKITLFARHPVVGPDWRPVAPGYDPATGYYYAGPPVPARDGTAHLDAALRDFCFRTPADRANYLGQLVTVVLMPHFIGCKGGVLFNANQPGLGKTMLAQMLSLVRDGRPAETVSYIPDDVEFEKQLGARVRRGFSTLIVDNAKGGGRGRVIESGCLERAITDAVVSFRLLGHSETIRAENSLTFCVTANAPLVGPDLVSRCAVVNLYHEGNPARRAFALPDPEAYVLAHRTEILGELLGMVERWVAAGRPLAAAPTRFNKKGWGAVVGGVLAAAGYPGFLSNAAESAAVLDPALDQFTELVGVLAEEAQGLWTPAELVALCRTHGLLADEIGAGTARSQATRLGTAVGRFVGEEFGYKDLTLRFLRQPERKGSVYRVVIVGR